MNGRRDPSRGCERVYVELQADRRSTKEVRGLRGENCNAARCGAHFDFVIMAACKWRLQTY